MTSLPENVQKASERFNADVAALCRSFKGRRFNRQTENEFRARVGLIVRQVYAAGSFLLDYRDEAPIWDADLVHVAVRFERNELTFSITRKQGKPS